MTRMGLSEREKRDAAFATLLLEMNPERALRQEMTAARQRAGLSQRQLAQRMDTAQSTIAALERGDRSPNFKTLRRMAEATGSRLVVRLEANA